MYYCYISIYKLNRNTIFNKMIYVLVPDKSAVFKILLFGFTF